MFFLYIPGCSALLAKRFPFAFPSYFGLQITEEINALKRLTSEIKKPITLIIGGSKISTKIKIIKNLIKKFDNIIIVGGMANTMLSHAGYKIGKSIRLRSVRKIFRLHILYFPLYKLTCNCYYLFWCVCICSSSVILDRCKATYLAYSCAA